MIVFISRAIKISICEIFANRHMNAKSNPKQGYEGDGFECVDVDECQQEGSCPAHASCNNSPGAFECVCDDGYSQGSAKVR